MKEARQNQQTRRSEVEPGRRSVRGSSPVSTQSPKSKSVFAGRALWVSLALIAFNLIVYAPAWHHEFLNWDDPEYVSENPRISEGLMWHNVSWAFATGHAANWHPLTWLSHMLDAQIYGLNAGPHHLTNVLFHIANTILLFGLLHRITGALGRSALVAGLFAIHPLHVESVAWVAERKDVLSTLFWLLTLWAYAGYVRQPRWGRYLWVLLLFALGLMAKPMLVTLPFVLLLLDFWPLSRAELGDSGRRNESRRGTQECVRHGGLLVREKLPLLALAVASSIVTFVVQQRGGAVTELLALPLKVRVANAVVSYVAYIGKMLWPVRLAVVYPYPQSLPEWWVFGIILVGLIGVSVVLIRAARRRPYLLVGWLWYLGTLVPVIGLVQVGSQPMADRYTYVPLIGLFLIVVWGGSDLLARWRYRRIAHPAAAALAIVGCTILARGQVRHWENSMALWEHALEVTTENYRAHNNLGNALADQGKVSEAITHYSEALRIKSNFEEAHNNLGNALAKQGKLSEAVAHYSEALRIKPDYENAHNGLGSALDDQGRLSEAIAHYSEALHLKPDFADAHNNLGAALVKQGRIDGALHEFLEALRIQPGQPDYQYNVAVLFRQKGDITKAVAHLEAALSLNPGYPEARRALDELRGRGSRK